MSRWFRHYAGMMRDDKLVRVAIRSKQSVERVLWVWGAILESAAEIDDGGRFDFDVAEAAYFLRADEADIGAIVDELAAAARISEGAVAKWSGRQFTSDRSAERVRRHRERLRNGDNNGGRAQDENAGNDAVTLQGRHCNSPETETETEEYTSEAKASSVERAKRTPASKKSTTGHRLPDDWQPEPFAPGSVAEQAARGKPPGWIERELSKFRDWAASATGANARKANWQAAWRNWIVRADENGTQTNRTTGSIRGNRPDPALDMWKRATAELAAAERPDPEDHFGTWPALPSFGTS